MGPQMNARAPTTEAALPVITPLPGHSSGQGADLQHDALAMFPCVSNTTDTQYSSVGPEVTSQLLTPWETHGNPEAPGRHVDTSVTM